MNLTALTAALLASLTTFTGSAAPATVPAAPTQRAHTVKWRLIEATEHSVGKNVRTGTDVVRSVGTGKIVGYDSYTFRSFPARSALRVQIAAAVKGGIVVYAVHGKYSDDVYHGRILRGTGKFVGAKGKVTASRTGPHGSQALAVIRYQL